MNPEEQFLAQLELIDRVIDSICRRHRCFGAEAEDFGASVKLKLIDDDYAVFRKFQGKSLLATYLTTVIANLFRDFRIRQWGKWRPSAAAKRMGDVAILLDQCLHRDSLTFDEAVGKLQTDHQVTLSPDELWEIAIRLPSRSPRRQIESDERLEGLAGDDEVDRRVLDQERIELLQKAEEALNAALKTLPAEDRLVIKLRFRGCKVSRIAETLRRPQRKLYSRIEKSLKHLRQSIEASGLTREDMHEVFGWKGFDLRLDFDPDDSQPNENERAGDDDTDREAPEG
ncbi:MAG: sigma-70 family RNA polymerase sigma factor [Acidobacteriota bacterium]